MAYALAIPHWTAEAFDDALHTPDRVYLTPLTPARAALAAIATRSSGRVTAALAELEGESGALAEGVRLLSLSVLERYDDVLAQIAHFRPSAGESDALEGTVYAMIAAAVADTEQQNQAQAIARLHTAQLLSEMLGMKYRAQWTLLEGQRLRVSLGTACPNEVLRAMRLVSMSPARALWAGEIRGAALLALGHYDSVRRNTPIESGVWAFAQALNRIPTNVHANDAFSSLTLAVQTYQAGADAEPHLSGVTGQPAEGYAALLRMAVGLRDGVAVSAGSPPVAPDQRFLWGLLIWESHRQGLRTGDMAVALTTLTDACRLLTYRDEVLLLARWLAPVATAAFLASPLGGTAAVDVPVLYGEHLEWAGVRYKLPGKRGGGQALVLQALGVEREVSRVERLRLRRALDELALPVPPVNVVDLLRALHEMAQVSQTPVWRVSLANVTNRVSGRVVEREIYRAFGVSGERYAEHD